MDAHIVKPGSPTPLAADELDRMHAWWPAANYQSLGQVLLLDNSLSREPLTAAHVWPAGSPASNGSTWTPREYARVPGFHGAA